MMYLDKPPQLVEARMFSSMPAEFAWCFLEMGGCQPRAHPGGLFHRRAVIRYPFGRIFRIPRDGIWSLIIEYDGWTNDLKIAPVGRCWWPTT